LEDLIMKNGTNEIKVGDKVRSFDFEGRRNLTGERACYIEGVVMGFREIEGCQRYEIKLTRRVFGGEDGPFAGTMYPPVNGTSTLFGDTTDGVVKIEEDTRPEAALNALKLILCLHENPACSPSEHVYLAPMTLEQIKSAIAGLEARK
jgi:hypothetical protein